MGGFANDTGQMMSKTGLSAWMGLGRAAALTLALLCPVAAQAQFSDNYNFLKAVKDADGQKVTDLLQKPGSTVVNSRDVTSGETALHIVIARRDATWLAFMLAKGGNPNLTDNAGNTPLMKAVQGRFEEGVRTLIAQGAQVDKVNGSGETPLIRAVQLRDLGLVRLLVAQGANPDKRDSIAGMSARDYANRDNRTPGLIEALAAAKTSTTPKGPVQGPVF
jgi:ankyrin repeat protein